MNDSLPLTWSSAPARNRRTAAGRPARPHPRARPAPKSRTGRKDRKDRKLELELEGTPPDMPRAIRVVAYAYLVSVPFEIVWVAAGRSVSFWLALALIGLVAGQLLLTVGKGTFTLNSRIVAPLIAITVFSLTSYFWSFAPASTYSATGVLAMSALTMVALAVAVADTLGTAFWALALGTSAMSIEVLRADVGYEGRADIETNLNDLAVLLAVAAVIVAARISRGGMSRWARVLGAGMLLLHIAALFLTGSRAAFASLVIALALLLLVNVVRVRVGSLVGVAMLVVVIGVGMAYFGVTIPERIADTTTSLEAGSLSNREDIWVVALEHIPSIVGIGFGAASSLMQQEIGQNIVTHSVYLGLNLEVGVLGFLLWAWLVVRLVQGIRASSVVRELAMAGVVLAVMASTLTLETRRPLWVVFALLAATSIKVPAQVRERRRVR